MLSEDEYNELKNVQRDAYTTSKPTKELKKDIVEPDSDVGIKLKELERTYGGDKIPLFELRGIWKDKVFMSDDFDEPLEEMRAYI